MKAVAAISSVGMWSIEFATCQVTVNKVYKVGLELHYTVTVTIHTLSQLIH